MKIERRAWARRLLGYAWLSGWVAVLWVFVDPWRHLGGIESEWLRWLEGWALTTGLILGGLIGRFAREAAVGIVGRTHAALLRYVFYPPAAIAAIPLDALRVAEEGGPVGVVATAFLQCEWVLRFVQTCRSSKYGAAAIDRVRKSISGTAAIDCIRMSISTRWIRVHSAARFLIALLPGDRS